MSGVLVALIELNPELIIPKRFPVATALARVLPFGELVPFICRNFFF